MPLVCPMSRGARGQPWAGHRVCPSDSEPAHGAQGPQRSSGIRARGRGGRAGAEVARGLPLSDEGLSRHVDGWAWCSGSELVITLHHEGHQSWPRQSAPAGAGEAICYLVTHRSGSASSKQTFLGAGPRLQGGPPPACPPTCLPKLSRCVICWLKQGEGKRRRDAGREGALSRGGSLEAHSLAWPLTLGLPRTTHHPTQSLGFSLLPPTLGRLLA